MHWRLWHSSTCRGLNSSKVLSNLKPITESFFIIPDCLTYSLFVFFGAKFSSRNFREVKSSTSLVTSGTKFSGLFVAFCSSCPNTELGKKGLLSTLQLSPGINMLNWLETNGFHFFWGLLTLNWGHSRSTPPHGRVFFLVTCFLTFYTFHSTLFVCVLSVLIVTVFGILLLPVFAKSIDG